jgi:hypothetical protein
MNLSEIKPGDIVIREIAGVVPHALVVTKVTPTSIHASAGPDIDYEFSAITGGEIDLGLGWDGLTLTGSKLVRVMPCAEGKPFTVDDLARSTTHLN